MLRGNWTAIRQTLCARDLILSTESNSSRLPTHPIQRAGLLAFVITGNRGYNCGVDPHLLVGQQFCEFAIRSV